MYAMNLFAQVDPFINTRTESGKERKGLETWEKSGDMQMLLGAKHIYVHM